MNMILGEYVGLYFYSAVFQGNMALLALVGVFGVFRIQLFKLDIDRLETDIVATVRFFFQHNLYNHLNLLKTADVDILKTQLEGFLVDPNMTKYQYDGQVKRLLESDSIVIGFARRATIKQELIAFKSKMSAPLYWTTSVIVTSLVLLPIAQWLHFGCFSLEILFMAIVLFLNCFALYKIVSFAKNALN